MPDLDLSWPTLGMTVDEAAKVLRVDRRSVLKSIKEDGLPARKVGRAFRISYKALQDWLASGDLSGKEVEDDDMPIKLTL